MDTTRSTSFAANLASVASRHFDRLILASVGATSLTGSLASFILIPDSYSLGQKFSLAGGSFLAGAFGAVIAGTAGEQAMYIYGGISRGHDDSLSENDSAKLKTVVIAGAIAGGIVGSSLGYPFKEYFTGNEKTPHVSQSDMAPKNMVKISGKEFHYIL